MTGAAKRKAERLQRRAIHPGELDLKDDKATAMQLCALINIIVQSSISAKAQIEVRHYYLAALMPRSF